MTLVEEHRRDGVGPGTPPAAPLDPDFPVLDVLRAVGALAVLTTHTAFWTGDYLGNGVWGTLLSRLDVGVALFFVLSGFLLTRPRLARFAAGLPQPATGRYLRKRGLRIYPVYAVTVVAALALVPDNHGAGPVDWLRTLLMLDTFTSRELPHGLTQMWSLAVEVSFYLCLPLLMALIAGRGRVLRSGRIALGLLAMTAVSLAWPWAAAGLADLTPGVAGSWLPGYLSWFAGGMALALVHVLHGAAASAPRPVRLVVTVASAPGCCWALAGALMLVAATPLAGPSVLFVASPAEAVTKQVLYAAIGVLLVAPGVFATTRHERWVANAVTRHLGRLSYSVFCLHLPLIGLVVALGDMTLFDGGGLWLWALTLAVTLPLSEVTYRLVERPAMRLARRPGAPEGRAPRKDPHSATTHR